MHPYNSLDVGTITAFKGTSCNDNSGRFVADSEVGKFVYYTGDEIALKGSNTDEISSLNVPFGYSVDLFADPGFSGKKFTVTGGIFEDKNDKMECISIKDTFNDTVNSLRVYKNRQIGAAQGYWRSFTASQAFSYQVYFGLSFERIDSTADAEKQSLMYEMQSATVGGF